MIRGPGAFVGVLLLVASGCDTGPRYSTVRGTVTFDGVPIEKGQIQFQAADGDRPSAKGGVISKGAYTAEVPPGEVIVRVNAFKVIDKRKMYDTPDSPEVDVTEQYLPSKYNSETTLKATIDASAKVLDFKLTSK